MSLAPTAPTGWRAWNLVQDTSGDPLLCSLTRADFWTGPVKYADRKPALAGAAEQSGIHAYGERQMLNHYLGFGLPIYGQVTFYGTVAVHETGYRAEKARIDRLFLRVCGMHPPVAHKESIGSMPRWCPVPRLPAGGADRYGETEIAWVYCCCDAPVERTQLSSSTLRMLAAALGERYGCEVQAADGPSGTQVVAPSPTHWTPGGCMGAIGKPLRLEEVTLPDSEAAPAEPDTARSDPSRRSSKWPDVTLPPSRIRESSNFGLRGAVTIARSGC